MKYRRGEWYVFCDICGQRYYASETKKLSTETGRGGLIACPYCNDDIDYGLIPYKIRPEKNINYSRINHADASNDYPVFDLETENVGDLTWYTFLSTSQDDYIIELSQNSSTLLNIAQENETASTVEQYSSYEYLSTSQGCNELIIPSQFDTVLLAKSQEK